MAREVVIVNAVRTGMGRRNGMLSGVHPVTLAAKVLRAVVDQVGVSDKEVGDVVFGNVSQVAPADYLGFPVSTEHIPGHSHQMREASATDLAHRSAMITAEMLAAVAVRIATDPRIRDSLRA